MHFHVKEVFSFGTLTSKSICWKLMSSLWELALYLYIELNIIDSYIKLELYHLMNVTFQSTKIVCYSLLLRFGYSTMKYMIIKLLHVLLHRSWSLSELLQIKIGSLKTSFMDVLLAELLLHSFVSANLASSFFFPFEVLGTPTK